MIQAKSIHKSYDSLHVLKGVDLTVNKGEIVSIVGASGAGKTTLLQILATLDTPSLDKPSSLLINNIDVNQLNEKDLAKFRNEHLGFVFQFHRLLPEFSALENVMIPQMLNGLDRLEAAKRAEQLLAMVGLQARADYRPGLLSGGEQQRVAIARSVANAPRVLLADEPTGNLDPDTAKDVFHHLSAITRATGTAALVVTHNQQLALNMDSILTISDSKIISIG